MPDRFYLFVNKAATKIKRKIFRIREESYQGCSSVGDSALQGTLRRFESDIVHLNWVIGGFVNFKDLQDLKKPIVVTLHDCITFTGICHVIDSCEHYKNECGNCPKIGSGQYNDLSHRDHLHKQKFYKDLNMTFVAPSKWMAEKARQSSLLKHRDILVIPNGINSKVFYPVEKAEARKQLKLDEKKRYLLFGAVTLKDENKGFDLLIEALKHFSEKENVELLTFGEGAAFKTELPTNCFDYISDDNYLALIYSAADVMIVPSKQESFGQTASEALACGTPVVAFGATGLLDIIDHKKNGYLAEPYNVVDLAEGISWCLKNNADKNLSVNGRNKVLNEFDVNKVSQQYKHLFETLKEV